MPLHWVQIKVDQERYLALVASVDESTLLGKERLDRLRLTGKLETIDETVLEEIKRGKTLCDVVVHRLERLDGRSLWRFDSDLSLQEQHQLAVLLVRSQIEIASCLARLGVKGHFIVDLGHQETLVLKKAVATLLAEIDQHLEVLPATEAMRGQLVLHRHLLCNFLHFVPLDHEAALRDFIPRALPALVKGKGALLALLEA